MVPFLIFLVIVSHSYSTFCTSISVSGINGNWVRPAQPKQLDIRIDDTFALIPDGYESIADTIVQLSASQSSVVIAPKITS